MPGFESGVFSYIEAQASVKVYFPVDSKGNADICCYRCPYLSSNERMCLLNKRPVVYPHKYVGPECPLESVENKEE